ncbi:MAG: metallophosphoesterase family protein [Deltaproteobacteria bacterium]|nr:metallophosphoesterase family protein [Deltaproteobacteria bacterium]
MRYAVISDVHSNLEALTAFLTKADRAGYDRIVCLGDIVGYNANPNECIELLREREALCVMGNHDSRAAGLEDESAFNFHAALAIQWTRGALKEENREFLGNLPRALQVNRKFLAVHGWVNDTDLYILGPRDAAENFKLMKDARTRVCFFGHTHVPAVFTEVEGGAELVDGEQVRLLKGASYLINPGSIGQPRDRDPRLSFVIYDTKKSQVKYYRVEYDISATAGKILAAGLPDRLAERLKLGW